MGVPPQTPPRPPSRAEWNAQQRQWRMQASMQRDAYRARYYALSRRSVVGPLLLIAIGVVALLMTTHHINSAYFWQWYGHWWPLVLIGAGVVMALESLAGSGSTRIRLGGGVVLLGIILALVGIAASHHEWNWSSIGDQFDMGNGVNLSRVFGNKHEASEEIQHDLPPNATVILQNAHGDVAVGSSAPSVNPQNVSPQNVNMDQLKLTLKKAVYTNSNSDARRKMEGLQPLITANGNTVVVHMPSSDSESADMNMVLPAKANLQVRAGHGDVAVNGRQAAVDINADHGDTTLNSIAGPVHVVMHQGDFAANNIQGNLNLSGRMDDVAISRIGGSAILNGDFFGDVHLEKVGGPMRFHSSRTDCQTAQLGGSMSLDGDDLTVNAATGPIAIATHAKDITLRQVSGAVNVRNSDGSVEVSAVNPIGVMNIENRNGSVQVTLPASAKFSVQATATDGEVHSDFNLSAQNGENQSTLSGSIGSGGPMIRIIAEKGDITLHKSE